MAKVERNILTQGLNGSIGGQMTFVTRHGVTIAKTKHTGTDIPPTSAQVDHRIAFGLAVQSALVLGLDGGDQHEFVRDFLQSTYPSANNTDGAYN